MDSQTDNRRYPLAEFVCTYGGRKQFAAQRQQSGQWVFWQDRCDLVLEGKYHEIMPLHVEFTITYRCNYECPWCSCRKARKEAFSKKASSWGTRPELDWQGIERVLYNLAIDNVGIQWTGGEPFLHPDFCRAVRRARELGISQSIFTNGSRLTPSEIEEVMDAEPAFIRISLNAVTPEIHSRFHGLSPAGNQAYQVLRNINALVAKKLSTKSPTLIGLSVVLDADNTAELDNVLFYLRGLCDMHGPGAVEFCIIRPAYCFDQSQVDLNNEVRWQLQDMLDPEKLQHEIGGECGIRFVIPPFSFSQPSDEIDEQLGGSCLASGMFGEITPWGELIACSDKYGDTDYSVGNLTERPLREIWESDNRARVLQKIDELECFRHNCPRNGRGFQINRQFHQIERFRERDSLKDVRIWMDSLRLHLRRPEHSFFL